MKFLIRAAVILLGVIAFLLGKISIQLTKTSDQIATLKPLTYGEWNSLKQARLGQLKADGIKATRYEGEDLLPVVMLQDSYVNLNHDTLDVNIVNPTLDVRNSSNEPLDVKIYGVNSDKWGGLSVNVNNRSEEPVLIKIEDVNVNKSIPVHVNR